MSGGDNVNICSTIVPCSVSKITADATGSSHSSSMKVNAITKLLASRCSIPHTGCSHMLTVAGQHLAFNTLNVPRSSVWRGNVHCVLCSRSEEHTSELQSLMRISYAVFCLKNKTI